MPICFEILTFFVICSRSSGDTQKLHLWSEEVPTSAAVILIFQYFLLSVYVYVTMFASQVQLNELKFLGKYLIHWLIIISGVNIYLSRTILGKIYRDRKEIWKKVKESGIFKCFAIVIVIWYAPWGLNTFNRLYVLMYIFWKLLLISKIFNLHSASYKLLSYCYLCVFVMYFYVFNVYAVSINSLLKILEMYFMSNQDVSSLIPFFIDREQPVSDIFDRVSDDSQFYFRIITLVAAWFFIVAIQFVFYADVYLGRNGRVKSKVDEIAIKLCNLEQYFDRVQRLNSKMMTLPKYQDENIENHKKLYLRIAYKFTWVILTLTILSLCPNAVISILISISIMILNRLYHYRNHSNQLKSVLTVVDILLEYVLFESLFYNTRHFENYYQLQFKEVYSIYSKFNIVITPLLLLLNTFGNAIIWFCMNYLLFNWRYTKLKYSKPCGDLEYLKLSHFYSKVVMALFVILCGLSSWLKCITDWKNGAFLTFDIDILIFRTWKMGITFILWLIF